MPWSIVGLGLLAACMLALFGPFGRSQCTVRVLPTTAAQQRSLPLLQGHPTEAFLCTNVAGYPMIGAP
ncbi:MAG TPA: hypothetical protein VMV09_03725 [Candidatus Saccharimonadales bacterium]|nr:hypothetical protein [Candidatus Saccharimonadales bacterium]